MELLTPIEISEALLNRSWILQGNELVRIIRRDDFAAAIEFVNSVAAIADRIGHHPDIDIRWNTVTLRLSTHSMGGVTDADVALAKELESIC